MRIFWIICGIILFVGIAAAMSLSGVKEYKRVDAIDREIAALENDVDSLERRNSSLEERVAYFSSNAYKEYVAKERLGYRKEGDHVVVMRLQQQKEGGFEDNEDFDEDKNDTVTSPTGMLAWLKHFFIK